MINEYALDPVVLSSWASNDRDYAEFLREYGLGTPRLCSSFPKKKASKFRSFLLRNSHSDQQSLASQRYTEMVLKLVESIVNRDTHIYQVDGWNEMAIAENKTVPFDVILSSDEIELVNNITLHSMYSVNSIWNHPRQQSIFRTNSDFISRISNLLRLSNEKIIIVDPYGWTSNSIKFIRYLLSSIMSDRINKLKPMIVLYYKEREKGSPSASHVKNNIIEGLTGDAASFQVEVFELKETPDSDVFHNRCILTEHGGVSTGHGISLPDEESHTDEMYLLDPEIYQKKWQQFNETICFELVSESRV
jgi:hypothetical protein